MTNNITPNRASTRRRPREYADAAVKQAAYRAHQIQNAGLQIGTRVQCHHGQGIVIALLAGNTAFVGFSGRIWRDVAFGELTIIGQSRKVPYRANPELIDAGKKRTVQLSVFPRGAEISDRLDRAQSFVRSFRRRVAGKSREHKDYSAAINLRLAKLVFDAARNGRR